VNEPTDDRKRSTRLEDESIGQPSMILDVVVRAEFHALLLASVWLLFVGHNLPGGGFVGGLVVVAASGLRLAAGGSTELLRSLRVRSDVVLSLGLLLAAGVALLGMVNDGSLLESRELHVTLPWLGEISTSTAFFFDLGVYLVVVGSFFWLLEVLSGPEGDGDDE
jgi:multisubunit Na+/H+ antiporter MnhB subunit